MGDGSDGWDKYIFVELGADPAFGALTMQPVLVDQGVVMCQ